MPSDCSAAEALLNLLVLHMHAVLSTPPRDPVIVSAWQPGSVGYRLLQLAS